MILDRGLTRRIKVKALNRKILVANKTTEWLKTSNVLEIWSVHFSRKKSQTYSNCRIFFFHGVWSMGSQYGIFNGSSSPTRKSPVSNLTDQIPRMLGKPHWKFICSWQSGATVLKVSPEETCGQCLLSSQKISLVPPFNTVTSCVFCCRRLYHSSCSLHLPLFPLWSL